jgi:hypothetical protein
MTIREKIRSAWRWFCRQFWWDETLGPMMSPQIGLPVAAAFLAVWGVLVDAIQSELLRANWRDGKQRGH